MKSHQFILVSLELQGDFLIKGQKTHRHSHPSTQSLKENRVASPAERLGTREWPRGKGAEQKCQAKTCGARSIHLVPAHSALGVSSWLVPRRMLFCIWIISSTSKSLHMYTHFKNPFFFFNSLARALIMTWSSQPSLLSWYMSFSLWTWELAKAIFTSWHVTYLH